MTRGELSQFLDEQPPATRKLINAVRKVVRRTVADTEESYVWGCLSFHRPEVGGRVKGAVCQIVVRKGKVRLDFIHGVRLQDPNGLLQGNLKSKRYVPIETVADAERREIAALIREADALDPTVWK